MTTGDRGPMPEKTHATAVVLVPPKEVWEPIQRIRRVHDRHVEQWMPHVTLVYPFRPRTEFHAAAPLVAAACARVGPFEVTLEEFRFFHHRHSFTAWLDPRPSDEIVRLQREIAREFPDCDDVNRFEGGFRPHLVRTVRALRALPTNPSERTRGWAGRGCRPRTVSDKARTLDLNEGWRPPEFVAREVAMIWRGSETGDVFRVARTVGLGGGTAG